MLRPLPAKNKFPNGHCLAPCGEGCLVGYQPQPHCRSVGLHPVVDLEFVEDIRKMKIDRSLRHEQHVSGFLAAVALGDEAQNLNFPL